MSNLWKLITGSLHEKNFEAKTTNTISAEGRENGYDDRGCNTKTSYDDAPHRCPAEGCYVPYYDDDDGDDYYRVTASCTGPTFNATASDFYIGVNTESASTVYLPAAARDGKIIIVKAAMKPPIGKRKITVTTTDGSTIDGYGEKVMHVSHESLTLIRHESQWWIIRG